MNYRTRALFAASTLYFHAKQNYDLEACNVYVTAALHVAPELFAADDHTELFPEFDAVEEVNIKGYTLVGLGLPTVHVKV